MRRLRFLFDYISHNAYLAWARLPPLAARHGLELEPVPVLFAGLLKAWGQLGPAEVPPKSAWMIRDVLRKAQRHGIPINPPAAHPFNPLLSLRVTGLAEGAARSRLVDALFRLVWVDGGDPTDAQALRACIDACGLDGDALLAQAAAPPAKARLLEATEDAIAAGVFGVPTMLVDDALFWGFDDLPALEEHLAGRDPLPAAALARWRATPVGRHRKPPGAG